MTLPKIPNLDGLALDPAARQDANAVLAALGQPKRLGVAFSGGVDSATLLALAAAGLGAERVVAIIGVSPSLPPAELFAARELAAHLGVPLEELATDEITDPKYLANDVNRCFVCRDTFFDLLDRDLATQLGLTAVAYGENADDAGRPDRPGAQAASEHGVLRPLAAAGLTKARVRHLARQLGLPVADKPAAPCLASRIPHGEAITEAKLAAIRDAEAALHRLGFVDCRVRHHGTIARIEVPKDEIPRLLTDPDREQVLVAIRKAGFQYVTVDLNGLQSGKFTRLALADRHD